MPKQSANQIASIEWNAMTAHGNENWKLPKQDQDFAVCQENRETTQSPDQNLVLEMTNLKYTLKNLRCSQTQVLKKKKKKLMRK